MHQSLVDPLFLDTLIVILRSEFTKEVKTCRSWLPRRCPLSGKWLFLKPATKMRRYVPSEKSLGGYAIKETYWVCPRTWLYYCLKGTSYGG